jgi:hypothetical protein
MSQTHCLYCNYSIPPPSSREQPGVDMFSFHRPLSSQYCSPQAAPGAVVLNNLTNSTVKTKLEVLERELHQHEKDIAEKVATVAWKLFSHIANLSNNFAKVAPHRPLVSLSELWALRLLICRMTLFSVCDLCFCILQQFVSTLRLSPSKDLANSKVHFANLNSKNALISKLKSTIDHISQDTNCCKMQKCKSQTEGSVILQIDNRKAHNSESDTGGLCGVAFAKLLDKFAICENNFPVTVGNLSNSTFKKAQVV